jgi:serine/threonine protein kinase
VGQVDLHPDRERLAAFGLGKLTPEEQAEVEGHVEHCEGCCQALRDVPDDTLFGRMRTMAAEHSTQPAEAEPRAEDGVPAELAEHPRYRIVRLLGAGGMGVVYQAEHRLMGRLAALKIISRRLTRDPQAVQRFRLEVQAAARLAHPNIVTVYDADRAGDLHFLVMEFVEGVNLARYVEEHGPLAPCQAVDFARQAALGLEHAFACGMVHRDIKPQNLMLTPSGQVKILDFGLARVTAAPEDVSVGQSLPSGQSGMTAEGMLLGSVDYLAPEQAVDPRQADIRADIYSLGCTLYFLLAGHAPFARRSQAEKLASHRTHTPTPLEELRCDLPPGLSAVIQRMMAKDPSARYPTPGGVAQALLPFGQSSVAPSRPRRRTALLVAGPLLLLAGCLLAAWQLRDLHSLKAGLQHKSVAQPEETPAPPPVTTAPSERELKLLMVLSSRDFFFPDYHTVQTQLVRYGFTCHVASSTLEECQPQPPASPLSRPVEPELLVSEAVAADYDVIYFAGGRGCEEYVGQGAHAAEARRLIEDALAAKRTVAAMGIGVVILAEADVLRGRKAACFPWGQVPGSYSRRIQARGVVCADDGVVDDGLFLTGAGPEHQVSFIEALVKRFGVEPQPRWRPSPSN